MNLGDIKSKGVELLRKYHNAVNHYREKQKELDDAESEMSKIESDLFEFEEEHGKL